MTFPRLAARGTVLKCVRSFHHGLECDLTKRLRGHLVQRIATGRSRVADIVVMITVTVAGRRLE